jgi:hypothetical protein
MSVHETSLFFRGKSDRNVMIAPLEGAEGAMGVVVYGNQEKKAPRGRGQLGWPCSEKNEPSDAWKAQ